MFVVEFLFVLNYLESKYLLVKIGEHTIENLRNTNDGEMTRNMTSLYRRGRSYPETVPLKERYIGTCKNEKLKAAKSFTVDMEPLFGQWAFTADLGQETLSTLFGNNGGICNYVSTDAGSQGCGLATTLMEFCFTEDKVGGFDVQKIQEYPKEIKEILEGNEKAREIANENCEHIVYLKCSPIGDDAPAIVCSAYLTAAINTEHTMMFVQNVKDKKLIGLMNVMKVANIQPEFKKNADEWIQTYGPHWFFCQCKPGRMTQCQEIS